ncbi:MAG: 2-amino-4-hydroxy-6-hydroxymethyldihydropteridine diphosphokinase, partial [Paraburkholderia sp.]
DILLYGDQSIDEPDLIVPHPRLIERAFALVPLVELEPALTIPQHGRADAFLAAVADQRIEKMKSPCQCQALNALSGGNTDAAKVTKVTKGPCS